MESVKEKEITIVLIETEFMTAFKNTSLELWVIEHHQKFSLFSNSLSLEIVVKRDDPYGMVPWLSASMDLLE